MERPRCIADCLIRSRDGEFFVLNPHNPGWWAGTQVDLDTMRLFDGTRSRDDAVREIGEMHRLAPESAAEQVDAMLAALERQGFLAPGGVKRVAAEHTLDVVYLHLTRRCNLRCKYCYLSAGKGLDGELSTEEWKGAIRQVRALAGPMQGIAITGGEPMLHPDFWEITGLIAADGGAAQWLATNGTLVTEENAPLLAKRFREVQVSLDGTPEVHDGMRGSGAYARAVEAIRNLTQAGANVKISATVSKRNLAEVAHAIEVAGKYGVKSIKTGVLLPFGKAERALMLTEAEFAAFWRRMQALLKESGINVRMESEDAKSDFMSPTFDGTHSCGAAINSLSIDADGSVYPCQASHFPEFRAGSLRDAPLAELWRTAPNFERWRGAIRVESIPGCQGCEWLRVCGGGCRMQAYAYAGAIDRPYPFCSFTKGFFEEGIQGYLKWLLEKKAKRG